MFDFAQSFSFGGDCSISWNVACAFRHYVTLLDAQESLTFWMHAPGVVEVSPGTLPLPGPASEVDIKVFEKKVKILLVHLTTYIKSRLFGRV